MKICSNIVELTGNTPLLELNKIEKLYNLKSKLFAKLEMYNHTGSAKDRIAKAMIEQAEKDGLINENSVIIEPTSGNTGIGLASVCAAKGYKVIFTMPESMSIERRKLLKAYGAEIVLTEGKKGMQGAVEKAKELASSTPNSFIPSQFENPANPMAHKKTTGVEIWNDTDGNVDIFVAGIGTGGTISGAGEFLKSKNPDIKVVAVEPYNSPLLSKGTVGSHGLQGIGANFIPNTLNTKIYDEVIDVKEDDAYKCAREVAQKEGLLIGISSGAALSATLEVAKRPENQDKNIVVVFVDSGEKYLSTSLYEF
jgi:cysteine synthase